MSYNLNTSVIKQLCKTLINTSKRNMLDNQTIKRKDSDSFSNSKQIISQTSITESDSQTIEELLKQLEEQETKVEKADNQSVTVSSTKEAEPTKPKETPLVNEIVVKQEEPEKTEQKEKLAKEELPETNFKISLEPLKNAKLKYEQLGQPENEKKISGAEALETYLYWVEESRKLLSENLPEEKSKEIFPFIPKRIQQQIEKGETPSSSTSEESGEPLKTTPSDSDSLPCEPKEKEPAPNSKEDLLLQRIRRLEDQINKLNQDKPEYPEELQPLVVKKFLMEEEIKKTEENKSKEVNQEKSKQELSAQNLINKQSFENKAPVIQPQKEERERIQKAQLAEKIEKEEVEKKEKTKKEVEEEPLPSFTSEQMEVALQKRKEFHKKLYSLNKTEWYQSPSVNRDFVNKQIIQAATILSGRDSMAIDMRDVQTARIFMFNNISKKILSHPAFSYVESFYNYQSSQSCLGVNPEEIFSQNNDPSLKTSTEEDSKLKKKRFFVDQLSIKENEEEEISEKPIESIEEIEEEEGTGEKSFLD